MESSKELVEEVVIGKDGPSTQPLLLPEEIEKEDQRFQGHSACAPCSVCPDAAQSRSAGVAGSTTDLTGDSASKNTQSRTEQNMEEIFSQFPFIDSETNTSNTEQKHEMWGSNEKDSGDMERESDAFLLTPDSSNPEDSFISRGETGDQRGPASPDDILQQQAEPSLPSNVQAACYSSTQHSPPLPMPQLLPSDTDAGFTGASDHSDSLITGAKRFREMLKIPYKLELVNKPGRTDLKHIIIDGCNVALSHGLNKFLSCRGIAIAVEYFWERGHRKITVFVPQSLTWPSPVATEQHFLTQLQELGILALTPSRTVFGERIYSRADRFILRLADQTGGVIVSNYTFREFVNESVSWREIIAKRLLQYTFVGDIFMVPDDPLGRNGPWLEDFLRKEGFLETCSLYPEPCRM
ncbi:NEDD4-binding protein 1 [Microtus ochrogaster]|uniref:NEDD4-binding protein 1 n=1 Tax=Microtus ochrogaster TaxID=79684 RepID=A0A8J6KWZ5_MICOH|nr:NEDD4-binding protein 1 [Microtus ochrogaster]